MEDTDMAVNTPETVPAVRPPETPLSRWHPFDEFNELWRRMEDLFSRSSGYTPLSRLLPGEPFTFEPTVDIFDKDDHVELIAAVPGFVPEDIKVEATPEYIMLQGERKSLHEDKAVPHRQRWASSAASFCVSYAMPAEIDSQNVKAILKDGMLRVTVPKTETARAKTVPVKIETA
jgi:HSP20 family protein